MEESKKSGRAGVKPPLCILGTAPSIEQTPFDDETYEIWGHSTVPTIECVTRVDRLFEMHPKRHWGNMAVLERLNSFEGPVYMQGHYDEIPNSVSYPREEIQKMFHLDAMGPNLYVTNTITWMILLAIYEGYKDISLYGVHMAHETEYAYQRASCSWALGIIHGYILQGKPYKIYLPEEAQMLKAEYEYGYDEPTRAMNYIKGRIDGMNKGIKEAETQMSTLKERQLRTEGAVFEAKHLYDKLAGFK